MGDTIEKPTKTQPMTMYYTLEPSRVIWANLHRPDRRHGDRGTYAISVALDDLEAVVIERMATKLFREAYPEHTGPISVPVHQQDEHTRCLIARTAFAPPIIGPTGLSRFYVSQGERVVLRVKLAPYSNANRSGVSVYPVEVRVEADATKRKPVRTAKPAQSKATAQASLPIEAPIAQAIEPVQRAVTAPEPVTPTPPKAKATPKPKAPAEPRARSTDLPANFDKAAYAEHRKRVVEIRAVERARKLATEETAPPMYTREEVEAHARMRLAELAARGIHPTPPKPSRKLKARPVDLSNIVVLHPVSSTKH